MYIYIYILNSFNFTTLCQVRAQGRHTRGSVAMRLKEGDKMASMDIIPAALWSDFGKVTEAQKR